WAANPLIYEDQIRNALYEVRQAVCQGYDADTPALKAARQRIHSLLNAVVDHSAAASSNITPLMRNRRRKSMTKGCGTPSASNMPAHRYSSAPGRSARTTS